MKIFRFDPITNFRLLNAIIVFFLLEALSPLIRNFQGELWSTEVISAFMLLSTLSIKFQKYIVNLSLDSLYKIGTILHSLLVLVYFLFFIDKMLFIYSLSVLDIVIILVFSTFSLKLDSYLTKNYHNIFEKFKVIRNSIVADVTIFAFIFNIGIVYFFSEELLMEIIISLQILFSIWLFYNWNFFKKIKIN